MLLSKAVQHLLEKKIISQFGIISEILRIQSLVRNEGLSHEELHNCDEMCKGFKMLPLKTVVSCEKIQLLAKRKQRTSDNSCQL
jgi:hypothetical protein